MRSHAREACAKPARTALKNLYGHPLAGLLWDKGSQERIRKHGFEKIKGWESLYVHKKWKLFLQVYVDDFHMAGITANMSQAWRELNKTIDLDEPSALLVKEIH